MKSVVMEIQEDRAVLLRRDGVLESCPARKEWRVGDTVSAPGSSPRVHRALRFVAAAACLALFFLGGYGVYFLESAVVSIDVNPSIELYVNRLGRVLSAKAVNEDAEALLAAVSLPNLPYKEAIERLLPLLAAYEDDYMLVTVHSGDSALRESIAADFLDATEGGADVRAVDDATLHSAHDHGMTAGKYLMIEELRGLDPTVDAESYGHHSISELRAEIDSRADHICDCEGEEPHVCECDGEEAHDCACEGANGKASGQKRTRSRGAHMVE